MYIFGHNKYYVTNTKSLFFVIFTTPQKPTIFRLIAPKKNLTLLFSFTDEKHVSTGKKWCLSEKRKKYTTVFTYLPEI
jgi:hypothetical protein